MTQNKLTLGVILTTLLTGIPLRSAKGEFLTHPLENHSQNYQTWDIRPEFRYLSADANFNDSGQARIPVDFLGYERIQSDWQFAYAFHPSFTLFTRLTWGYLMVGERLDSGYTGTATGFGFMDQTAGVAWRLKPFSNGWTMTFQLQGDFPFYENSSALQNGTPFMGDGTIDGTGAAFLEVPMNINPLYRWSIHGGAGYTLRSNGFSMALPWSIGVKFDQRQTGVEFGALAHGVVSLGTDSVAQADRVNQTGGLYFAGSSNPSHLQVSGNIGYRFSPRISIKTNASTNFYGTNTPRFWMVGGLIDVELGPRAAAVNSAGLSAQDYGRSNRGFVTYSLEAKVMKMNDRLGLIKIDKGYEHSVEKGQFFDIFSVNREGAEREAIARAKVVNANAEESALEVVEYFKEVWIEEGFIAKRPLETSP